MCIYALDGYWEWEGNWLSGIDWTLLPPGQNSKVPRKLSVFTSSGLGCAVVWWREGQQKMIGVRKIYGYDIIEIRRSVCRLFLKCMVWWWESNERIEKWIPKGSRLLISKPQVWQNWSREPNEQFTFLWRKTDWKSNIIYSWLCRGTLVLLLDIIQTGNVGWIHYLFNCQTWYIATIIQFDRRAGVSLIVWLVLIFSGDFEYADLPFLCDHYNREDQFHSINRR